MAVSTAVIAGIGLAVSAGTTGYQISEQEAAKDQAKAQKRKQEQQAKFTADEIARKDQQALDQQRQKGLATRQKLQDPAAYNPTGIQGTNLAEANLASVVGAAPIAGRKTLLGA